MNTNLLIINNHDSFTYNLVDLIRQFDVPFSVVNVEQLNLDEVDNFSHILISPYLMCRVLMHNCLRCWNAISIANQFWVFALGIKPCASFLAQPCIICRKCDTGKRNKSKCGQILPYFSACLRNFKLGFTIRGRSRSSIFRHNWRLPPLAKTM